MPSVQRKPVGSGLQSPPPADFVIPSTVPHEMPQAENPYHAISRPPTDRRPTTTAAPGQEWRSVSPFYEVSSGMNDAGSDHQDQDYSTRSVISGDASEGPEWESATSVVYPPMPPTPEFGYDATDQMRGHAPDYMDAQVAEDMQQHMHSHMPPHMDQRSLPHEQTPEQERQQSPATPETPSSYQPSMVPPDEASLGIGTGSDYVKRRRKAAGITSSSITPTILPIGIKAVPAVNQHTAPPAFVRKAMDIRYAHLPQRMLASEIDDEDNIPESPGGLSSHSSAGPAMGHHRNWNSITSEPRTSNSFRRSSSSESIVEDVGKIKLFVANPDN